MLRMLEPKVQPRFIGGHAEETEENAGVDSPLCRESSATHCSGAKWQQARSSGPGKGKQGKIRC